MSEKKEEPLSNLRLALENLSWPQVYMFKFIIPSEKQVLAQTSALFTDEASVVIKESSKGNYISITARELMLNVEDVITRYEKAMKIKGLIAL